MAGPVRETIMVSALQHYAYCPRQCALIHVDMAWEDNLFTMRGHRAHEIIDIPQGMTRAGLRVETALPIWSEELGLIGRADVVEFLPDGTPYPVEHKVGPRKYKRADEIQLCAQAICLEEMLGRPVPEGALFYRKSRRRRRVGFDAELMRAVHQIVVAVRLLMTRQIIPPPVADARCTYCSLKDICLPSAGDLLREAEERG
jgi:CRISPR-associated exonuclease Cas4